MMKFEAIDVRVAEATNSLKPVRIVRSPEGPDNLLGWMVEMPEGDLYGNFTAAGPFVSFDAAKRYAEMNVGFTWKELADALA